MIRSGVFRITLTLNNNIAFTVNKSAAGVLSFSGFSNNASTTNPFMFSASYKTLAQPATANTAVLIAPAALVYGCGSSVLGALAAAAPNALLDTTFVVKSAIANLTVGLIDYKHKFQKCHLYVPAYILNPEADRLYLSNKVKVIDYLDIDQYTFSCAANGEINQVITNGIKGMRRLIMVGLIEDGNGTTGKPAQSSPFTSEPSTTSPFKIDNMNVFLAGNPIYESSKMRYDYEQFLQELNGAQGVQANLTQGLCSGRISLQDFNNNYHYIVVNLDRKLPENESVSQTLSITGKLVCGKNVKFFCFIERYKQIKIDVDNGMIVA
jgi:hypothetical protein